MTPLSETLDDNHEWFRVADPEWTDPPLDTTHSYIGGGRWNSPRTRHVLYLCADESTARAQIPLMLKDRFATEEDLATDAYYLVTVKLPPHQTVADIHSARGISSVGLPPTYPIDHLGGVVSWPQCQAIGDTVAKKTLAGVHCLSAAANATTQDIELAWFPSTGQHAQQKGDARPYGDWR